MKKLKIAVDFDGTVVDHRYPEVGPDVPLAVEKLQTLVDNGHKIILYTMRSGDQLMEARLWFQDRNIKLYAVGKDIGQESWTSSNKCHADICIDDRNYGVPLILPEGFERPCVNWEYVPSGE